MKLKRGRGLERERQRQRERERDKREGGRKRGKREAERNHGRTLSSVSWKSVFSLGLSILSPGHTSFIFPQAELLTQESTTFVYINTETN